MLTQILILKSFAHTVIAIKFYSVRERVNVPWQVLPWWYGPICIVWWPFGCVCSWGYCQFLQASSLIKIRGVCHILVVQRLLINTWYWSGVFLWPFVVQCRYLVGGLLADTAWWWSDKAWPCIFGSMPDHDRRGPYNRVPMNKTWNTTTRVDMTACQESNLTNTLDITPYWHNIIL